MDKKAFQEELKALAQTRQGRRSNTAIIAEVIDDIEEALAGGIKREAILQALQKQGVTLTLEGFQSAMRTLRKRRKTPTEPGTKPEPANSAPPAPTQSSSQRPLIPSNTPRPLVPSASLPRAPIPKAPPRFGTIPSTKKPEEQGGPKDPTEPERKS